MKKILLVSVAALLLSLPFIAHAQTIKLKGLTVTPSPVKIKSTETGNKRVKVALAEKPTTGDVTLKPGTGRRWSGGIKIEPVTTQLRFTSATGYAPLDFDFKLVNSKPKEGDSAEFDLEGSGYSGVIKVVVQDKAISGTITATPDPLKIELGDTTKHLLSVKLSTNPGANLTVTIGGGDLSKYVALGATSLTFTPTNFGTAQSVGITQVKGLTGGHTLRVELKGENAQGLFTGAVTVQIHDPNGPTGETTSSDAGPAGFGQPLVKLLSDPSGFVYISWRVVRTAINSLLIVALLLISFTNILRINIDTYTVKRALPNLVIGVILANVSFLVIKYMADLASVATYFFVGLPAGGAHPSGFASFTSFFANALAALGIDSLKTIGGIAGLASPILMIIFAIIAVILVLWLAFLLYFRLVAVYLLTILAPLAFVAYGIPGAEKYFKQWWQQFTKWLFILPAMCAVFWLMLVIHGASDNNNSIASLLIMYILFTSALTLPSKMGGAILDKASKAFQKYTGVDAARKGIGDFASTKGQQLWYRMPGVARVAALSELNKANAKKDIEQLKKRGMNKILEGRGAFGFGKKAGLNQAKLSELDKEIGANEAEYKAANEEAAEALFKLSERVNAAEFKKRLAEEKKNAHVNEKKLEFMIKHDKDLMAEVAKAIIDQEVLAGEVGRQEGVIKGGASGGYLQPLQAAQNWKRLNDEYLNEKDETKKAVLLQQMNQIQESFNTMVKDDEKYKEFRDPEHLQRLKADLKSKQDEFNKLSDTDKQGADGTKLQNDIAALQTVVQKSNELGHISIGGLVHEMKKDSGQGRIWMGRQRQTLKMFNAGVAGQIESDIKEQTVSEIQREMENFFKNDLKNDKELIKSFLDGDTAKVYAALGPKDSWKVRNGIVAAERYKTILKSTNDIRHGDALASYMELTKEYGDDRFDHNMINQVFDLKGNNALQNETQARAYIEKMGQQGRRRLAALVTQHSGPFSRLPNARIQNSGERDAFQAVLGQASGDISTSSTTSQPAASEMGAAQDPTSTQSENPDITGPITYSYTPPGLNTPPPATPTTPTPPPDEDEEDEDLT